MTQICSIILPAGLDLPFFLLAAVRVGNGTTVQDAAGHLLRASEKPRHPGLFRPRGSSASDGFRTGVRADGAEAVPAAGDGTTS